MNATNEESEVFRHGDGMAIIHRALLHVAQQIDWNYPNPAILSAHGILASLHEEVFAESSAGQAFYAKYPRRVK